MEFKTKLMFNDVKVNINVTDCFGKDVTNKFMTHLNCMLWDAGDYNTEHEFFATAEECKIFARDFHDALSKEVNNEQAVDQEV